MQESTQRNIAKFPRRKGPTRPIPFVVVAPAAVVVLGAVVVIATLFLGIRELEERADEAARFQSRLLADTLASRLTATPAHLTERLLTRAVEQSKNIALLLNENGTVQHAAPRQPLSEQALEEIVQRGTRRLNLGGVPTRASIAELPTAVDGADANELDGAATNELDGASVLVLSPVPTTAQSRKSLVTSLATFAGLLLAAAGFVAWALARDVHADVLYLRKLIVTMAQDQHAPSAAPIPVRTIDQVGQLTASFNMLLERFQAAERAYRQDLDQARAYDKDRSEFLAALSHELRTPLNAILGFTDVLLNEIDGPLSEEARENLTVVRTSGEHLRSLIDDILALSALESGEFRLSRERLDLESVASDVVTEARVTAEQKGITVELKTRNEGPYEAYADRRRMRQVYQNVISNAVKFTNQGGVEVELFRDGNDIVTVVSDTGPGIAEDALEGIFDEFEQAGTGGSQRQGTGLGLSITRRLVHMHGGSVRVQSVLDQGSMFMIRIPVEDPTRSSTASLVRTSHPVIRG